MSNDARVASNIVTGIGFLGAGAIFKEGASVKGLTTATTIWISAAIGMAIGVGQYSLAISVVTIVILVLVGFTWLPTLIDKLNTELTNINTNISVEKLIDNYIMFKQKISLLKTKNEEFKLKIDYL